MFGFASFGLAFSACRDRFLVFRVVAFDIYFGRHALNQIAQADTDDVLGFQDGNGRTLFERVVVGKHQFLADDFKAVSVFLRQPRQKLDIALLILGNAFDGDIFNRPCDFQFQTACNLTDNGGQSRVFIRLAAQGAVRLGNARR